MKLKITTKWTLRILELGMVSSFHPHSMCKRVEMVTVKTGRTSCTNSTISFGVSSFHMETHLFQRDFIFFNLFEVQSFSVFKMHHSNHIINFNPFWLHLVFFMHLLIIWAKWLWNWKELQMISKKVESWHGIIISPT